MSRLGLGMRLVLALTTMLVLGFPPRKILHFALQVEWVVLEMGGQRGGLSGTLKGWRGGACRALMIYVMASSLKVQGIGDATSETKSHDVIGCSGAAHKQLSLLGRWAMLPSLCAKVSSPASLHPLGGSVRLGTAHISSQFCSFHFCNIPVEYHDYMQHYRCNTNTDIDYALEFSGYVIS